MLDCVVNVIELKENPKNILSNQTTAELGPLSLFYINKIKEERKKR